MHSSRYLHAGLSLSIFFLAGCELPRDDKPAENLAAVVAPSPEEVDRSRPTGLDPRTRQSRLDDPPALDSKLRFDVESALRAEPSLQGSDIEVRSSGGVVTLKGTTEDSESRRTAAQVALSVQGVTRVQNELVAQQT